MKINTEVSLFQYLIASLDLDQDAIYFKDSVISGKELKEKIIQLANYLKNLKVERNDIVSICLPNIPEAIFAFYAINRANLVINMIHDVLQPQAIREAIDKTDSKIIFTTDSIAEQLIEKCPDRSFYIIICGSVKKKINGEKILYFDDCKSNDDLSDLPVNPRETALILNSGGTSGFPKLVELSAFAVNELAIKITKRINNNKCYYEKRNNALVVLPLFHGFGLVIGVHSFLSHCGTITLIENRNMDNIVLQMKKYKTSIIFAVPSMLKHFLKSDLFKREIIKQIEGCYVGGDYLNPVIRDEFNAWLKKSRVKEIYEGYGLTEMVTVTSVSGNKGKRGSVGKPLEGISYKIVDENGNELNAYEKGELYISGSTIMNGYFKDKKATEKTIYEDNAGNKWVKTGDIFYLDSDGYAYFLERKKKVFKIAGVNIFVKEIENIVTTHTYVKEAALIEKVDADHKKYLKLFLVVKKMGDYDKSKIKEEVSILLSEKLSKYAIPREIELIEKLPLTNIGKIDYKELQTM